MSTERNFDDVFSGDQIGQTSITASGFTFTTFGPSAPLAFTTWYDAIPTALDGYNETDYFRFGNPSASGDQVNEVRISTADGSEFRLTSFWARAEAASLAGTYSVQGYRNGAAVGSAVDVTIPYDASGSGILPSLPINDGAIVDFSTYSGFYNIDEFRIRFSGASTDDIYLAFDQLVTDAAIGEAPVLTHNGANPAYTEGTSAVLVSAGLTISDSDSTTLAGATVTITDLVAGDVLSFTNQNGILGSYNAGTGTLTLTGSATVADYQTALRSVAFSSTSDNPATGVSSQDRVISFAVNDGSATSIPASATVAVANSNDAPVLSGGPVPLTGTNEDSASPPTLVSTILAEVTTSDPDLSPVSGIAITAASGGGVWQYSTNGAAWTALGSVSNDKALLLSSTTRLRFVGDSENGSSPALTFRGWDQTSGTASANGAPQYADTTTNGGTSAFSSGTATASMTVTSVNDAPVLAGGVDSAGLNDSASAKAIFADVTVADVDTGESDLTLEVRLSTPAAGTLSGGGFTHTGDGVYRMTGLSPAQANAALDALTFTPSNNTGPSGTLTTTFTVAVNDQTAAEVTLTSGELTITRVNDAPTATNLTDTVGFTEDAPSVALKDIVVADVDTGDTITATLTLSDAAAGALSTSGTASYDAGAGVWSVTGSVADVNAALAAVAFTPAANWDQSVTITSRIRDQAGTGPGDGTITLNATPDNDAPVVAAALTAQANEGDAAFTTNLLTGASDVDSGETATLTVANVTYTVDGGTASTTAPAGVSIAGATLSVNPSDAAFDGLAAGVTRTILVSYDVKDAQGATVPQTATITITGTYDAPPPPPPPPPSVGPTPGDDTLVGTSGNDTIAAGGGDDSVSGGTGNDLLSGNDGADTLSGGDGSDTLFGGADNDLLMGGNGNDVALGGVGSDTLLGGGGADTLYAGEGTDVVFAGSGDDEAGGGAGADILYGGDGADTLYGGADNDTLYGGADNDVLAGGEGDDAFTGGAGDDQVAAGEGNDTVYTGEGNDQVFGVGGSDLVFGGAGADTLYGGEGTDTLVGGTGDDVMYGGADADVFAFYRGNMGDDVITGFNFADGDRLMLDGQSYTLTAQSGGVVVSLEDGGTILLAGLTQDQVQPNWLV